MEAATTQTPKPVDEKPKEVAPEQDKAKQEDQRVPYSRFEEVSSRAKNAEKELEDLRHKILEFEDRDKSEVERVQARAQRAESELQKMIGKVTSLEKGAWVRSAAAEANFHDPEDAVVHVRLDELEDPREAKRAVERLAKTKEHLIQHPKKEERPTIGKVFGADQPQQAQPIQQTMNPAQAVALRDAEAQRRFAEGLAEQLGGFRDKWHNAGELT